MDLQLQSGERLGDWQFRDGKGTGDNASQQWGVAVSGGADSVALLRLAHDYLPDRLHVIHLNHETRGDVSDLDEAFVTDLANTLNIPVTTSRLSALNNRIDPLHSSGVVDHQRLIQWTDSGIISSKGTPSSGNLPSSEARVDAALPVGMSELTTVEPKRSRTLKTGTSANRSARYRAARLELYGRVIREQHLSGVLVAHHADDQAETVLLRLLRGTNYQSLKAMEKRSYVGEVAIVRPLLEVRRLKLREHLRSVGQDWREDSSNSDDVYGRNRVRKVLANTPDLTARLLAIADRCKDLGEWVDEYTPELGETFDVTAVSRLPIVLARAAVAGWLRRKGVSADAITPNHVTTILVMCNDMAAPTQHALPSGLLVRRRGGRVSGEYRHTHVR
jgi:tRNA(Ile)-lysidine synthase TilS/MesJ